MSAKTVVSGEMAQESPYSQTAKFLNLGAEISPVQKVRNGSRTPALVDVSELTDEGVARGRNKIGIRLYCPICGLARDHLVITTRGAVDGGSRTMCATCDRERK